IKDLKTSKSCPDRYKYQSKSLGRLDPRSALRWFLLVKYIQVLLLPGTNELLLAMGAAASLHTLMLLSSPGTSRKVSTVLLGQLAWADGLLLLRWALGLLLGQLNVLVGLQQDLLEAHHNCSLLLLSCLSLEALLVAWWPVPSRRLRTAHHARLACTLIWTAVVWRLVVGQLALNLTTPHDSRSQTMLMELRSACVFLAVFTQIVWVGLRAMLWTANMWIYYNVFYYKYQKSS
uniref:Uncharacterized protein n=1 Tax=Denticeps clupeoides TaxID=299321 RepID=A0AAY4E7X6_9TELE